MDVLGRIKYLMDKENWSEYKLSKESGISQSTINSMFRNNNNPSIYTLENICYAFGITLSEFFKEDKLNEIPFEYRKIISKWDLLNKEQKILILNLIDQIIEK